MMVPSSLESTDAPFSTLLNEIALMDKRCKVFKAEKSAKNNAEEIQALSEMMRNAFKRMILRDTAIIPQIDKSYDVHTSMWKLCFYSKIEEFRRGIKKCNDIIIKAEDPDKEVDPSTVERANRHLVRLVSTFSGFLDKAVTFYQELMLGVEDVLKEVRPGNVKEATLWRQSIFRCLIYLGDLTRYATQNSTAKESDYTESQRYYERAAYLDPSSGHPHNQLAMLASYNKIDCVAISYYCRSILSEKPFVGGYDNLRVLFKRNAKSYLMWHQQEQDMIDKGKSWDGVSHAKAFLAYFMYLHGVLFSWCERMRSNGGTLPSTTEKRTLLAQITDTLSGLTDLLQSAVYGDSLLMKILVICMFSVHQCADAEQKLVGEGSNESSKKRGPCEALSLTILFEFVRAITDRMERLVSDDKGSKKSYFHRLMPIVSVFADWARLHSQYVMSQSYDVCLDRTSGDTADETILLRENRLRCALRNSLVRLVGECDSQASGKSARAHVGYREGKGLSATDRVKLGKAIASQKLWIPEPKKKPSQADVYDHPLREHLELRGFHPLSPSYDDLPTFRRPNPKWPDLPKVLPESPARDVRMLHLRAFVREVIKPATRKEVEVAEGRRMVAEELQDRKKEKKNNVQKKEKENATMTDERQHPRQDIDKSLTQPQLQAQRPSQSPHIESHTWPDDEDEDEREETEQDDLETLGEEVVFRPSMKRVNSSTRGEERNKKHDNGDPPVSVPKGGDVLSSSCNGLTWDNDELLRFGQQSQNSSNCGGNQRLHDLTFLSYSAASMERAAASKLFLDPVNARVDSGFEVAALDAVTASNEVFNIVPEGTHTVMGLTMPQIMDGGELNGDEEGEEPIPVAPVRSRGPPGLGQLGTPAGRALKSGPPPGVWT